MDPTFKVSRLHGRAHYADYAQALVYKYLWADKTKVSRLCESREAETNTLYSFQQVFTTRSNFLSSVEEVCS